MHTKLPNLLPAPESISIGGEAVRVGDKYLIISDFVTPQIEHICLPENSNQEVRFSVIDGLTVVTETGLVTYLDLTGNSTLRIESVVNPEVFTILEIWV